MAETHNKVEQEVEAMILAGFSQQEPQDANAATQDETKSTEPGATDGQPGGKRVIHVDKYSLPNGDALYRLPNGEAVLVPGDTFENELDANSVESVAPLTDLLTETPTTPLIGDEQEEPPQEQEPEPAAGKQRRVRRSTLLIPLVLLCLLAAGNASYFFLLPLTASATVTITPKAKSLHTETTFTIAANPKAGQVQGRPLEAISFTKSKTVPATGRAHDDARAARGVITFYNGDVNPLTIPAGVSFTLSNQLTIVTTASVTVQAAIDPLKGEGNAPAQAVEAGAIGNIPAHAIGSRCCGSVFLTATNISPFTGGQDARTYSFIQTSDIQNAASDLLGSLTPQATAALSKETQTGEQLVTPLCSPRTTSSQQAGAEAAEVTVSVAQQCTSVAYMLDSLQQVATSTLAHSANLANFQQEGTVQVTVNGSTYGDKTTTLKVTLQGIWVSRFSQAQLTQLTHQIAGESQEQTKATLEKVDGITSVSIRLQRLDFKDLLPTNPQHITMQFFYIVS